MTKNTGLRFSILHTRISAEAIHMIYIYVKTVFLIYQIPGEY